MKALTLSIKAWRQVPLVVHTARQVATVETDQRAHLIRLAAEQAVVVVVVSRGTIAVRVLLVQREPHSQEALAVVLAVVVINKAMQTEDKVPLALQTEE